jgi:hypothetical protein
MYIIADIFGSLENLLLLLLMLVAFAFAYAYAFLV